MVKFGKKISFLILLVCIGKPLIGQVDSLKLETVFNANFSILYDTKDDLGNWYFIDNQHNIKKYKENGKLIATYPNTRYGVATSIDATNPFFTLLFFQPQQKIIILDNTLNEINNFNLQDFDLFDARVACRSNDNNFWVYDAYKYQLLKISQQGKILTESLPIETFLGKSLKPTFLIEKNNKVFIGVENYGLLVFDNFGKYIQSILMPKSKNFKIDSDFLIFMDDNQNYILETTNYITEPLPSPKSTSPFIRYQQFVIFFDNQSFNIQKILN